MSAKDSIQLRAGREIGMWTMLSEAGRNPHGARMWLCRCGCGTEKKVSVYNLCKGLTKSCGCRLTIHGAARKGRVVPEFCIWCGMIKRCHTTTDRDYRRYGARGIKVCDRWRQSFADFLADVGPRPSADHSIDRIDNDGNYEPGNCRWATSVEQNRNKGNNHRLTLDGVTRTLSEWALILGCTAPAIRKRLLKMSVVEALTIPINPAKNTVSVNKKMTPIA